MKKLIIIFCVIISINGISQSIVPRSNNTVTVQDYRTFPKYNQFIPQYQDTTAANLQKGIDSAGALIFCFSTNDYWYRQSSPKKWVELQGTSTININNIYNNSIINIIIYNDSCIILQTGNGIGNDTICTEFTCGVTGWTITDLDSIEICGYICPDTINLVCHTYFFPPLPFFLFDNGLTQVSAGHVQFGGTLTHNTLLNTESSIMTFRGNTVFTAPYQFYQNNYFQNGTAIASFLNHGYGVSPSLKPISTRLIINFTGDDYNSVPPTNVGYYNNQIGYWLGTNTYGAASAGLYVDDTLSKSTGIFFNTYDSTLTDGMSFYAVPKGLNNNTIIGRSEMYDHRFLVGHTTKQVQLPAYGTSSTFNGASTDSVLTVDANGKIRIRNQSSIGGLTTPAGNFGNLQIGRNGVFDTPGSDSLDFESATGLTVKGMVNASNINNTSALMRGVVNNNALTIRNAFTTGGNWNSGLVWYSTDDNSTIPKTGIWSETSNSGSLLHLRTSANYAAAPANGIDIDYKGRVGINNVSPTAYLHLPVGTSTASTSPLKFTTASAALLGTPEAGAMEVLVDSLYWTGNSGTRYKIYPQVNIYNSDGTLTANRQVTLNGKTLNFVDGVSFLRFNTPSSQLFFGDFQQDGGNMFIDYGNKFIRFDFGASQAFLLDSFNHIYKLGDITSSHNSTLLTINDATKSTSINSGNTTGVTTSSSLVLNANSLTSGTGLYAASSTLAAGSLMDLQVNSTAAASNTQKVINVALSGANATASQATYGLFISNSHSGTGAQNFGVNVQLNNGTSSNAAYEGSATNGSIFEGTSTNGYLLAGGSVNNNAINVTSSAAEAAFLTSNLSSTNTVANVLTMQRGTTGTAANGIGGAIEFDIETATNAGRYANQLISKWSTATDATRTSQFIITGVDSASTVDLLILDGTGYMKLKPMTVAVAGTITPAEGMIVFVSDTNGTFPTIGLYCYQNGAWKAL